MSKLTPRTPIKRINRGLISGHIRCESCQSRVTSQKEEIITNIQKLPASLKSSASALPSQSSSAEDILNFSDSLHKHLNDRKLSDDFIKKIIAPIIEQCDKPSDGSMQIKAFMMFNGSSDKYTRIPFKAEEESVTEPLFKKENSEEQSGFAQSISSPRNFVIDSSFPAERTGEMHPPTFGHDNFPLIMPDNQQQEYTPSSIYGSIPTPEMSGHSGLMQQTEYYSDPFFSLQPEALDFTSQEFENLNSLGHWDGSQNLVLPPNFPIFTEESLSASQPATQTPQAPHSPQHPESYSQFGFPFGGPQGS